MKSFIPLFGLLALSFGGNFVAGRSFQSTIINGVNAQPGEAPFQVWVRQELSSTNWRVCGGALYRSNKVLTAAHCAVDNNGPLYIRYGTQQRSTLNYPDVKVKEFKHHPDWNTQTLANDLAILTLETDIAEDSRVKYATLQTDELQINSDVTIFGWGRSNNLLSDLPENLQKTTLKINRLEETRIIASSSKSIACSGDSGGVMVSSDGKAAGIASAVTISCPVGGDNYYTKISAFLTWINDN